jgi:hypothetical protein
MRILRRCAVLVVLAGVSAACASILDVEDGILTTDASVASDAASDAWVASDAASDALLEGDGDAGGCTSLTVDPTQVFVSTSGADLFDCGSMTSPCLTVTKGLSRARTLSASTVYVEQGTYIEQVSLVAGITIEGGWTAQWAPICTGNRASAVTLAAPTTANTTVLANDLAGTATLRALSIASKGASSVAPGESVYGVAATGATTSLVLDGVVVMVAGAGAGDGGAPGAPGTPGADGGCWMEDGGVGSGAAGAAGAEGPPGTLAFGATGATVTTGGGGGSGAKGQIGSPGGPGNCESPCYLNPGFCGGVLQCQQNFQLGTVCADAGTGGCPGSGGTGGQPGQGGGSSVALYVWGATVRCVNSALHAGNGGTGGAGGSGGSPGGGASGAVGKKATCANTCSGNGVECVASGPTIDGGTAGSAGGAGGAGGQGGGGAGGFSCAYYAGGDAGVTVSTTVLSPAEAGAGGAPNGPPGVSKEQCP